MCKPIIVYKLNRAHGLHFLSLSSVPAFRWLYLLGSLVEDVQQMKTVTNLPVVLIDPRKAHWFFSEDFGDIEEFALPLDFAIMANPSDHDLWRGLVVHRRGFGRIGAREG